MPPNESFTSSHVSASSYQKLWASRVAKRTRPDATVSTNTTGARNTMAQCSRLPSVGVPRVLVTGGAGFVGANLAVGLAERHPGHEIVAFDNLKRRGSELNLQRLREAGVGFVHGDVRARD